MRKRSFKTQSGKIVLQQHDHAVDYDLSHVITKFGVISVKF